MESYPELYPNGGTHQLMAKFGELEPSRAERARSERSSADSGLEGVAVENVTPQTARQLGLPANISGVVVTSVDPASPFVDSGLQEGDVIQEVNHKPINNVSDYRQAIRNAGKAPLLLVNRHGNTLFVAA